MQTTSKGHLQRAGATARTRPSPQIPSLWPADCQLGEVKVKFFGDSIAIAYGAESWIDKANDGKETKRCQIWTDTWLKRAGKWQIVAAQDTIVPCHP